MNRRTLITALAAAALPAPALAHHGFTGRYDTARPLWLAGPVTRADFAPPHPVIALRIEDASPPNPALPLPVEFAGPLSVRAEDVGQVREVEFPPVRAFFDLGARLRIGDRVAIMALVNCRPPHQLRSQWIRLADGGIIERTGRLSYMAAGCG
jgi:hypothetical protein